jgi:hypothetical protein
MARVALGVGVRELAAYAKVSTDTVSRFEREEELAKPNEPRNLDAKISNLPRGAMAEAEELVAWLRGRITLRD